MNETFFSADPRPKRKRSKNKTYQLKLSLDKTEAKGKHFSEVMEVRSSAVWYDFGVSVDHV